MTEAELYLERFAEALDDARLHALRAWPEESCGFVADGVYLPLTNHAADPATHIADSDDCACRLCAFAIADADYLAVQDRLQLIVHSHPDATGYPSKSDMAHQEVSGVAWVIIPISRDKIGPLTVWGGDCPIEPLVGREFIHGVTDCYSLIRDVFALGREKLAEQGVVWPHDPIQLPLYPRKDAWWTESEDNFYEEKPAEIGFIEIDRSEARAGDVFLMSIRSPRLNHGGVLLGDNLILHHLPQRLSRREPAGIWSRAAEKWIRYVGAADA